MVDNTPRHGFQIFEDGEEDWEHRTDFELLDKLVSESGDYADRPATGEYPNELYHALDRRILYRWDDETEEWEAIAGLGSSDNPVPGTSHFEALETESVSTEDLGIGTGEQSEDDLVFSLEDSGTVVGWTSEGDVLGRKLALEERNETTNWRLFYDENEQSTSRNDWNPFEMDGKDFGNSEAAWDDTDFKFIVPYDGVYLLSYVLNVNFTNADGTWNELNARVELNESLLDGRLRSNYQMQELDSFSEIDDTITLTGSATYNLNEGDELQPFYRNRMADGADVEVIGGSQSQLSITFVGGG